MNIYITGIAGLLAANIAYLLSDEYTISGCDLIAVNIPGVNFSRVNLLDNQELEQDILLQKPAVLIHCAAAVDVDKCETDKAYAFMLNDELTRRISDICSIHNIKMIYISTDAVFDGRKTGLYTESDFTNPINEYGKTKLAGEYHVMKNPNNIVARTNIYGFNVQDKRSFGEWVLFSLLEGKSLSMFEDIFFSPILVNDLAEILRLMIKKDISGLYNVCSTGSISKYSYGMSLKKIFNIDTGIINTASSDTFNFTASRSKNMGLDNTLIRRKFGISIRTPIESIERYKELYEDGYHLRLKEFFL